MRSETPEQPKSPPPQDKPTAEVLIIQNGRIVEELFKSQAWTEIVFPLIQESIASVSGRLTNGRYYHGGLTTKWDGTNSLFYAAYQKALMDFYNNLQDFIGAKDKLLAKQKEDKLSKDAPLYNPFMESEDDN